MFGERDHDRQEYLALERLEDGRRPAGKAPIALVIPVPGDAQDGSPRLTGAPQAGACPLCSAAFRIKIMRDCRAAVQRAEAFSLGGQRLKANWAADERDERR